MIGTLDDFCDEIMRDESPARRLEPEGFAEEFSAFFGLSGRPTLDELTRLYETAGIGKVSPAKLPRALRLTGVGINLWTWKANGFLAPFRR